MSPTPLAALAFAFGAIAVFASCNAQRQKECDQFLSAMKPLDEGLPNADMVDRVEADLEGIQFQDEPLREYSKNYKGTLIVLSNTLKLQGSPSAPDGTEDVVKTKWKEAHTDRDDVARYCAM